MAKKRRQKDERRDDDDYQFPEFDEKEYIEEEMLTAKATFIAAGLSLLFVMVSYFLTDWNWKLAMVVGVAGIGTIFLVVRFFGIELDDIPKKNWAGVGAVYIFTWLAVWVLLASPPIVDNSEPVFWEEPTFYQANENDNGTVVWTEMSNHNNLRAGDSYLTKMVVRVVDNQEVDEGSVTVQVDDRQVPMRKTVVEKDDRDITYFELNISSEFGFINGTHSYIIHASDVEGNSAQYSGTFAYT